jgi:predicted dehydrogenase
VDATVKQLLSSGAIGEVLEVDVVATTGQSLDSSAPLHWRQRSDYSGVNMLFIGAHYETMLRYLPPVDRVIADGSVYVPTRLDPDTGRPAEVAIPDAITAIARNGPRQRQVYHLSAGHSGPASTVYELHGTEGALRVTGGRLYRCGMRDREWAEVEIDPSMAADWEVEAQFVASIRDGRPVTRTSFEDGVRYMELTEAAWRSWQEGRAISLPLDG